jgi:hypothetical protein
LLKLAPTTAVAATVADNHTPVFHQLYHGQAVSSTLIEDLCRLPVMAVGCIDCARSEVKATVNVFSLYHQVDDFPSLCRDHTLCPCASLFPSPSPSPGRTLYLCRVTKTDHVVTVEIYPLLLIDHHTTNLTILPPVLLRQLLISLLQNTRKVHHNHPVLCPCDLVLVLGLGPDNHSRRNPCTEDGPFPVAGALRANDGLTTSEEASGACSVRVGDGKDDCRGER